MSDPSSTPRSTRAGAALGLLLGGGLVLSAAVLGHALVEVRTADRYVTVRGLAEREVSADLAVWPIHFSVSGDDLKSVHASVERASRAVGDYLAEHGFAANDLHASPVAISDLRSRAATEPLTADRYVAEATLTLRSSRVDAVRAAVSAAEGLVARGVALRSSYPPGARYFFTGLSAVKPAMIAEATRDARRAAARFAEDSGSLVGGIRRASQGYFTIEDRDPFAPEYKRVRVVATVEYFLADDPS